MARSDFPSSRAWSAAETSGSDGEKRAILSARMTSMALINRVGGNRTTSWLSLEVSTSSLQDRALAGPICDPGVARKTRLKSCRNSIHWACRQDSLCGCLK